MNTSIRPNLAQLGNWLHSWTQPSGAVHGFHNHSVWGGNPYRYNDFSSGHSTWTSPFLAGLALALKQEMNAAGLECLNRCLRFQCESFQENGHFKHIGFQTGNLGQVGLILNAITTLSLGLTALYGKSFLDETQRALIRAAIIKNMDSCRIYGNGRPDEDGTCNQEYARIWGKIVFDLVFEEKRWYDEIPEDLDFMIRHYHVSGLPDSESEGTYRQKGDENAVEPAEYYGLMIAPLVLAYEVYGDRRYLEHAGRLCRHVARSSWTDTHGQTRFHRLWYRHGEAWRKMNSPMLIAGMGDSLEGIDGYLRHEKDADLESFLKRCDATYAHYQNPRGFFAAATGWQSEIDVVPSTAWHSHDFRYLVARQGLPTNFWGDFFKTSDRTSVVLGDQCFWVERDPHWKIADYFWQDVTQQLGRKDEDHFGRDLDPWLGSDRQLAKHFHFSDPPMFLKDDEGIYLKSGDSKKLDILSVASLPFRGKMD